MLKINHYVCWFRFCLALFTPTQTYQFIVFVLIEFFILGKNRKKAKKKKKTNVQISHINYRLIQFIAVYGHGFYSWHRHQHHPHDIFENVNNELQIALYVCVCTAQPCFKASVPFCFRNIVCACHS